MLFPGLHYCCLWDLKSPRGLGTRADLQHSMARLWSSMKQPDCFIWIPDPVSPHWAGPPRRDSSYNHQGSQASRKSASPLRGSYQKGEWAVIFAVLQSSQLLPLVSGESKVNRNWSGSQAQCSHPVEKWPDCFLHGSLICFSSLDGTSQPRTPATPAAFSGGQRLCISLRFSSQKEGQAAVFAISQPSLCFFWALESIRGK